MACWRSAAISVRRVCLWPISTEFFPGFLLAIRFYGGPPIRGRCCGPGSFHLSRSMKRFHQRSPYRVTLNHAFGQVIEGCADNRDEGTWITSSIVKAYHQLHELGHAHSIEVWQGETLVGGMYGVAQGALFCGESMFSRAENASKTALLIFCQAFIRDGGKLIDCQVLNKHTASLGAVEIPRRDYLDALSVLRTRRLPERFWVPRVLFTGNV